MTSNPEMRVVIRPCTPADLSAVQAIYAHEVETGLASFEYDAPSLADMTQRFEAVRAAGLPYLVAAQEDRVLGYAYASAFRTRIGYRYTVEDSVYLAPAARGQGLGTDLLEQVIQACTAAGYRQMMAAIGDSGNAGSIALHKRLGFDLVGVQRAVGLKLGQWVDVVLMQRALGEADQSLPDM